MELWIRSQDRECLMKIDRVDYDFADREHRIMVNGYEALVGRYKAEEKALEILDEIQQHLVIINDKNSNDFYVYEMPKE